MDPRPPRTPIHAPGAICALLAAAALAVPVLADTGGAVRFASARPGGNYHLLAIELARRMNRDAETPEIVVLETDGSYANADLLRRGEAELALMQSDVAYLEHFNAQPFKAIASLYTEPVHIAVRRELDVERLSDLRDHGKPIQIAIGESGSGTASHALTILTEVRFPRSSYRTHPLGLAEAIERMRTRDLDLIFRTSAVPVGPLESAAQDGILSVISLDRSLVRRLKRKNPFFVLTEIPYDVYAGRRRNVGTVGTRALVVARTGLDGSLVEAALEVVYEIAAETAPGRFGFLEGLSVLNGLDEVPIPVHETSLVYHNQRSGGISGYLYRYRDYFLPLLILVIPFLLLYRFSRIAFFVHQFTLGRILVLLVGIWLTGASVMYLVEGQKNSAFRSFGESAIAILHYLFSGLEAKYPITLAGNVVSIVILSLGVAVATLFTATVVTLLIERALNIRRLRVKPAMLATMRNHVVLTGWSRRAERVVRQLRSPDIRRRTPVVVITGDASKTRIRDQSRLKDVWAIEGDCCEAKTLKRADIQTARIALVLSDEPLQPKSDLRSVAATLAIERQAPQVHTVVEALRPATLEHLRSSDADEVVDVSTLSEKVISQCLITPGIMHFYDEVLSFGRDSQEFYSIPVPSELSGLTFLEIQRRLARSPLIPFGFASGPEQRITLNPGKSVPEGGVHTRMHAADGKPGNRLVVLADDADVLTQPFWKRIVRAARSDRAHATTPPAELPQPRHRGETMDEIKIGICGWNAEARKIIEQLQDPVIAQHYRFSIKVICQPDKAEFREQNGEGLHQNVGFVFGDATRREVLQNAGIEEFRSLVVLAHREDPEAVRYSDHRTLMVALAATDLNADLHVVAEVLQSENREHFERLDSVEIISVENLAEKILAQAVITPGVTEVFDRLLTASKDSNEIYIVPVPEEWVGRGFQEVYMGIVESEEEVLPLGYETSATDDAVQRTLVLNPPHGRSARDGAVAWRDYSLRRGDSLVVVAYEEPRW